MKLNKQFLSLALGTLISSAFSTQTLATGRQLDIPANFGPLNTLTADLQESDIVPISWDSRCANVQYTLNTSLTANSDTQQEIPIEEVRDIFNEGFNQWNKIRSSFINMQIVNATNLGDRPRQAFDFINEVTFTTDAGFGALASSPSSSLQEDSTFIAGEDLDGDGDPDVFDPAQTGLNTCTDIDQDGDIEWPAGDYKAGTILDNDIQFSRSVLWETKPENTPESNSRADLLAVAVHEFGHSHGLSHSAINQTSSRDGNGATMFPFIDINDPEAEVANRSLHTDDIAASAFVYPEGSEQAGIAAIQRGDVPFDRAFDIIKGNVFNGSTDLPVTGAVVSAIDSFGQVISSTVSGEAKFEIVEEDIPLDDPGFIFTFIRLAVVGINGDYELAVPRNRSYTIKVEALDGTPVEPERVSLTATAIDDVTNNALFNEEFYNGNREAIIENDNLDAVRVRASSPRARNVDFIVRDTVVTRNGNRFDIADIVENRILPVVENAKSAVYLERFDGQFILDELADGSTLTGTQFSTVATDSSVVSTFKSVGLAVGKVQEDGTVKLGRTLAREFFVTDQEDDKTPVVFDRQARFNRTLTKLLRSDSELDLFVVISTRRFNETPSGIPDQLIGVERTLGTNSSFVSVDGGPIEPFDNGVYDVSIDLINLDGEE